MALHFLIDPSFHLWFTIALTIFAFISFTREKISLETTAVIITGALLVFGQIFPLMNEDGENLLNARDVLIGYANPSLLAVLALLIMGQGVLQTEALSPVMRLFMTKNKAKGILSLFLMMVFILIASAFMNNTPLVILLIPMLQALANNLEISPSRVMMPLSFVAILGGMTTLIGSSTNLLVSSAMTELNFAPLQFFEFLVPGSIMAGIGFFYVIVLLPMILPNRSSAKTPFDLDKKEFTAEMTITAESKLLGVVFEDGSFPGLKDVYVRTIRRKQYIILPPFEGYALEENDILILSATRPALMEIISKHRACFIDSKIKHLEEEDEDENPEKRGKILCEVMIPPSSRLIDVIAERSWLDYNYGAILLGLQRHSRIIQGRLGSVRFEAGDVLLVMADEAGLDAMMLSQDLIVMRGSVKDVPIAKKAPIALLIFAATIVLSALSIVPITVTAFAGAVMMVVTGCLNFRQVMRSTDRKIYFLVGSALALGYALQTTGAAGHIANIILSLPIANDPLMLAALLFIIVAIFTNVLTNNACAILFTPIALNLAASAGIDPHIFAVTVILGANCSFASPIGYQTNLLVMGPGHYRFSDFLKVGIPLILLLWVVYIGIAKYYYGL